MHQIQKKYEVSIAVLAVLAIYSSAQQWESYFVLKPLTSLLILLLPLFGRRNASNTFKNTMLLGLAFCLVGDVFLLWDRFFVFGLGTFLVAHLLFAVAFIKSFGFSKSIGAFVLLLLISIGIYGLLWAHLGALKVPVLGYVLAIAFMTWQGLGAYLKHGNPASRLVALGAVCFMISDSLLGYNRFVATLSWASAGILSTYWFAIYCLAKATLSKSN